MGFFKDLFGGGGGGSGFSGKELTQETYDGKNFANTPFVKADITQCDFKGANLQGADFTDAKISQCDFSGANLQGANLTGAEVVQTEFQHANLTGAKTERTVFTQCDNLPPFAYYFYRDIDDDDTKWPLVVGRLNALRNIADGEVKERRQSDKAWFSGTYHNRPFRFAAELTWGHVTFELKVKLEDRDLTVYFDPKASAPPAQDDDPEWDKDEEPTEKRHMITPALYLEDDADELARQVQLINGGAVHVIAALMPAVNAEVLSVRSDEITLTMRDDLLHPDFVPRCQRILEASEQLIRALGGS